MNTTQAGTFKLEFKPKYLVHVTPCRAEGDGKKMKDETLMLEFGKHLLTKKGKNETFMLESEKQLPTKKHVNKAKIMHAWGDVISTLLIKLVIGFNNDECSC
jgi:hypothetical protein